MPLPRSLRGHGTFVYNAAATIKAYGTAIQAADEMVRCGMTAAWLRVHGRTAGHSSDPWTRDLLDALRQRNIGAAGWGWCHGDDPAAEAKLAIDNLRALGIKDYVADIEEGVQGSHWTPNEVERFLGLVRGDLPADGALAVSSFAIPTWHSPKLMTAAIPFVDAFAPQVYWFNYPNSKMQKAFGMKYELGNPAAYAALSIDNWRSITDKPLIATGQAYWKEGITEPDAERKVIDFLQKFGSWNALSGFNWWHFGGGSAMNAVMRQKIADARLNEQGFD